MRKQQSAETNMPSPENTLVSTQQILVPLMFHSALPASQAARLPCHDGLSNLVDDIGREVEIHLALQAAHTLVAQAAVSTVLAVPALPADLLSPAKTQVAKRLRASSKQDIKHVADVVKTG